MTPRIHSLLLLVSLLFVAPLIYGQEVTLKSGTDLGTNFRDYTLFQGHKFTVSDQGIVFEKNGKDYVLVNGKAYLIQADEGYNPFRAPITFYFENDKGHYITLNKTTSRDPEDSTKLYMSSDKPNPDELDSLSKAGASDPRLFWQPATGKTDVYSEKKSFVWYYSKRSKDRDPRKLYNVWRTAEGRFISEEEFQSFRGMYKMGRWIKSGDQALDTIIISPPDAIMKKREADRKARFLGQVGQPLPDLEFTDLEGKTYTTTQLKGKVVLINFWFTTCAPCVREMPELNELVKKYQDKPVVFLGLATNSEAQIRKFLKRKQFDYNLVPDMKDVAEDHFNVFYYPAHFIVDKQGVIRLARESYDETLSSEFDAQIQGLIK